MHAGKELASGSDYSVSYGENIHAGVNAGSVKVTGLGTYSGQEAEKTFDIDQAVPVFNKPSSLTAVYGQTLGDLSLASYSDANGLMDWSDSKTTSVGNCGSNYFTALYEPKDLVDYVKVFVQICVQVSQKELNANDFTLNPVSAVYNGSEIPVQVTANGLTADVDYAVAVPANAITAGIKTVTISGRGNYTGTFTKYFEITRATLSDAMLSLNPESYTYNGMVQNPEVTVRIPDGKGGLFTVPNTAYSVSYGNLLNHQLAVTVSAKTEADIYGSAVKYCTVNPENIADATLTFNRTYTYTGSAIKPELTDFMVQLDGKTLASASDYTIQSCSNNTAVGTQAEIVISGMGNYTGTAKGYFTIIADVHDLSGASIALADPTAQLVYNYGASVDPEVTVKDSDNQTLTKDVDYTVAYSGDKAAGEAVAAVTGMGKYYGKYELKYNIQPRSLTTQDIVVSGEYTYTGSEIQPSLSVSSGNADLVGNVDYTASYSGNINAGDKAVVTVTGTGNYKGTVNSYFTIQPADLSGLTIETADAEFTGSSLTPETRIFFNGVQLKQGTDYDVTYENNMNVAGIHTVTATGKGNFKNTLKGSFIINQADLVSGVLQVSGTYIYNGVQQKPGTESVKVIYNQVQLTAGTDYSTQFSYGENINAGTGTVSVTGMGNYKGQATGSFTIAQADPFYVVPTGLKATYSNALGTVELPEHFSWTDGTQSVGSVGTNTFTAFYTPEDSNYRKVLNIPVEVTVAPRELTDDDFKLMDATLIYTGSPLEPGFTVSAGIETSDYKVSYRNNVNAGSATAVIAGGANCTGTVEKTFTIGKAQTVISAAAGTDIKVKNGSGDFSLGAAVNGTGSMTYVSSDTSVLTVDASGTVKIMGTGSAFITVSCAGDANHSPASIQVHVTVTAVSSNSGSTSGSSGSGGSRSGGSSTTITIVPQNYTGGKKQIGNYIVPDSVVEGKWTEKEDGTWNFTTSNGEVCRNNWVEISRPNANISAGETPYAWYKFDENGNMQTGFVTDSDGNVFYLDETKGATEGAMAIGWKQIGEKWYYFDENSGAPLGKMLKGTKTPDGYTLNEDGSWDGNPRQV